MLKSLFENQRHHLEYFFDHLDLAEAESVLDLCLRTKGLLILTGVGKSGIVAEKIAMTLVSTGTKSIFLSPINFLHGDFGIVSDEDCVILLSKSGETQEILDLIPFIKKKKTPLIALVSNRRSRLAREADTVMILPVVKELCPFDLAPTISTEVQLLVGDVLAMALMQKKEIPLSVYGENHPSGTIGKMATIRVEDIMIHVNKLPLCFLSNKLEEALSVFSEKNLGCLLVIDEDKRFQGIFTEGDLRRSLQSLGALVMQKDLKTLMTQTPLTIEKTTLAWEALKLMQKNPKKWITMLPVLEQKKLVGLIRMHDIIHAGIT